jgi:hypothetical protein
MGADGQLAVPIALILFAESWARSAPWRCATAMRSTEPRTRRAGGGQRGLGAGSRDAGGRGLFRRRGERGGGRTLAPTALTAALAVLLLALFATGLIAAIPEPVLAAVVIAALAHALPRGRSSACSGWTATSGSRWARRWGC